MTIFIEEYDAVTGEAVREFRRAVNNGLEEIGIAGETLDGQIISVGPIQYPGRIISAETAFFEAVVAACGTTLMDDYSPEKFLKYKVVVTADCDGEPYIERFRYSLSGL